jgi:putative phage-type endonuclease
MNATETNTATLEQRSPEWHSARKGRITASMVGAILGHSPWMTRDDAMRSMVRAWHGAESEFSGNVATQYGQFHEPHALADYIAQTGNAVEQVGFITREDWEGASVTREDWAGCSPDGLIGLTGGLEIKCPYKFRHAQIGDMPTPKFSSIYEQPHYYDQVQFSLWICEREFWDFWQWAPDLTPALERVTPDTAWRLHNIPRLRKFHREFMTVVHDTELSALHLEPRRFEIDTPEAFRLLTEYEELAEAIDNAEQRKKEILAQMVKMAGERDALICGRRLTRTERAGSISYGKIVKEHLPDLDLERYRGKPSAYWGLK